MQSDPIQIDMLKFKVKRNSFDYTKVINVVPAISAHRRIRNSFMGMFVPRMFF